MLKLIRYLKDFKKEVILGPLFKLTEAVLELIVPLVMIKIIDIGVKNQDPSYVLKMGGIMLLLGVIGFACSLTCQRYAAIASQGGGTAIRNAVFKHINTFSHAEVDRFGTPSLITRITNDVNQLQLAVAMFIRLVIRAPFLVIGSAVMALILDLKLSIIFIVTTPVILLILYLVMSRSVPFFRIIQKKLDKISLITRENLGGTRVIRAFSKQEMEKDRFYRASSDHTNMAIKVGKISALLNPLTYVTINLAIVAIIWYGGMRVEAGGMTQGQVIAYVNYMSQILLALVLIANLVVIFTKAAASAVRVNEVLDVKSTIVSSNESGTITREHIDMPKIEFKDVSFSYGDATEYAIQDINIKINKGETVGIIGATGSGKSTIINLIPRLYDVSKGEVLVDGKNVKDYILDDLRHKIGVVPQRAVLFSGTVDENIRWGAQDATDHDIKRALDIAQASEFVQDLAMKGNTKITQGGQNLSGGQKQRLTIARALVGKPDVLILDDSASALDFRTDAALRKALKEKTQGSTVIIVSQRVSTIMDADKIIVLDNGLIKGIGSHAELNISSDVYKEICLSQLSKDEVKNHA
ncbi:MAG TPA: ABC transporter ATP-binding protein [Epulopiscium sp.]|nr:ABC transporter ATP-binding protein [Candidatus Epulonipiscium sp.]